MNTLVNNNVAEKVFNILAHSETEYALSVSISLVFIAAILIFLVEYYDHVQDKKNEKNEQLILSKIQEQKIS